MTEKRVWTRRDIYLFLFIFFSAYSALWSVFVLLRYYSFNADVIDLGLAASTLYNVTHTSLPYIMAHPGIIPWNKLIALPIALFFYVVPHESWLTVFQTVWIGLGIFPLYEIGRKYTGDWKVSMIISVSYLLYYPLGGVNWFDFHFMSIFPTAFLFSIMFHLRGKDGPAILFAAIGIFSDYLAPFIFVFLAFYFIWVRKEIIGKYAAGIFLMSAIVVALVIIFYGLSYTVSFTHLAGSSFSSSYVAPISKKFLYIIYMLLPLLFLSVLGIDFLLVGLPFFILVTVNSYQPYVSTMFYQYPALIAPEIFIASLVGLKRLPVLLRKVKVKEIRISKRVLTVAVAVLLINIVLFSFETPVGNEYTGSVDTNLANGIITGSYYSYYTSDHIVIGPWDSYLRSALNDIPAGSSVLIQNNMPQEVLGYNWSLPDAMPKGFIPDYIIIDPYSMFYNNYSSYPHSDNYTMMNAANYFLESGDYGILFWEDFIVVLSLHYSGAPHFIPAFMCVNPINKSQDGHGNSIAIMPFTVPGTYEFKVPTNFSGSLKILTKNNNSCLTVGDIFYIGHHVFVWTVHHFHANMEIVMPGTDAGIKIQMETIEP